MWSYTGTERPGFGFCFAMNVMNVMFKKQNKMMMGESEFNGVKNSLKISVKKVVYVENFK